MSRRWAGTGDSRRTALQAAEGFCKRRSGRPGRGYRADIRVGAGRHKERRLLNAPASPRASYGAPKYATNFAVIFAT
jgi:hypothetical protein